MKRFAFIVLAAASAVAIAACASNEQRTDNTPGNDPTRTAEKPDADLKDKLNAALEAAKADGTIDTLIAKWFPGKGPFYKK